MIIFAKFAYTVFFNFKSVEPMNCTLVGLSDKS
jgi:hypothetical protein